MEIELIPVEEVDGKERFIFFRPMKGIAFVGNRSMLNLVRDLDQGKPVDQSEAVQFLQNIGFLEPDPPAPNLGQANYQPTSVVLLMTNDCQLRCIYCYATAGERPKEELSFELAKTAIDFVIDNAQKRGEQQFSVSFHGGGEPVRAWKVLKACTEYARSQPIKADITLTSNGLWSATQMEWLIANMNGISLSIDGAPETQNHQRPTLNGKGSARFAMRSAKMLDKHDFPYGIRMTAMSPWTSLAEDVKFLCEETHCHSIQVEPAFNVGRSGHAQPNQAEGHAFMEAILKAYDVAEACQRKFYYAGARLGWVTDVFCAAPYNALIISPNGDLVTCYEITNRDHPLAEISTIGRIENESVRLGLEKRQHLHELISERRDQCRDCYCYWSCAGNCYTRAFLPGEGGHLVYGELCSITRTLVKELLLRQIASGDGVWQLHGELTRGSGVIGITGYEEIDLGKVGK